MNINVHTLRNHIVKKAAAVLFIAFLAISLCACSDTSEPGNSLTPGERKESMAKAKSEQKVHDTITDMLGFDIDDSYIEDIEMASDITTDSYGKVMILIKSGKEDELFEYLLSKFNNYENVSAELIPRYQEHQYANDLRLMTNIRHFTTFKTGKTAKSIDINIYMARKGVCNYLFIFG